MQVLFCFVFVLVVSYLPMNQFKLLDLLELQTLEF